MASGHLGYWRRKICFLILLLFLLVQYSECRRRISHSQKAFDHSANLDWNAEESEEVDENLTTERDVSVTLISNIPSTTEKPSKTATVQVVKQDEPDEIDDIADLFNLTSTAEQNYGNGSIYWIDAGYKALDLNLNVKEYVECQAWRKFWNMTDSNEEKIENGTSAEKEKAEDLEKHRKETEVIDSKKRLKTLGISVELLEDYNAVGIVFKEICQEHTREMWFRGTDDAKKLGITEISPICEPFKEALNPDTLTLSKLAKGLNELINNRTGGVLPTPMPRPQFKQRYTTTTTEQTSIKSQSEEILSTTPIMKKTTDIQSTTTVHQLDESIKELEKIKSIDRIEDVPTTMDPIINTRASTKSYHPDEVQTSHQHHQHHHHQHHKHQTKRPHHTIHIDYSTEESDSSIKSTTNNLNSLPDIQTSIDEVENQNFASTSTQKPIHTTDYPKGTTPSSSDTIYYHTGTIPTPEDESRTNRKHNSRVDTEFYDYDSEEKISSVTTSYDPTDGKEKIKEKTDHHRYLSSNEITNAEEIDVKLEHMNRIDEHRILTATTQSPSTNTVMFEEHIEKSNENEKTKEESLDSFVEYEYQEHAKKYHSNDIKDDNDVINYDDDIYDYEDMHKRFRIPSHRRPKRSVLFRVRREAADQIMDDDDDDMWLEEAGIIQSSTTSDEILMGMNGTEYDYFPWIEINATDEINPTMLINSFEAAQAIGLNIQKEVFIRHQKVGLYLPGICADYVPKSIDSFNSSSFEGIKIDGPIGVNISALEAAGVNLTALAEKLRNDTEVDDILSRTEGAVKTLGGSFILPVLEKNQYDPFSAPIVFQGSAVVVRFGIYIESISNFQTSTMDYDMDIYLMMSWRDARLVNPYDKPILVKEEEILEKIWRPDPFFANAKEAEFHEVTFLNFLMRIYPDGLVLYETRVKITPSCNLILCKYPHDKQTCDLVIKSFAYPIETVRFEWFSRRQDAIDKNPDVKLPELYISRYEPTVCNKTRKSGEFSCLRAVFRLKRDVGFHIAQTYIPTSLALMFSWVGVWLPEEFMEGRIGVAITVLLTLSTESAGAREHLPSVSYLKAIDLWFGFITGFVFFTLLQTLFVIGFDKRANQLRKWAMKKKLDVTEELRDAMLDKARRYHKTGRYLDNFCRVFYPLSFILFLIMYYFVFTEGQQDDCLSRR